MALKLGLNKNPRKGDNLDVIHQFQIVLKDYPTNFLIRHAKADLGSTVMSSVHLNREGMQ